MRIDRIELATSNDRVELRLHPNLTVVTGLGRLEREALTNEIFGAIGAGRPGLSLDVVADNGRFLEVHRPLEGPASVRDARTCQDLTESFLQGESVDILRSLGLSRAEARELLHFGQRNLRSTEDLDHTVARLAAIDQDELWSAAISLAEVEVEMATLLEQEAQAADPIDAFADAIEEAHAERDIAADRHERNRSQSAFGSIALSFIAVMVALITTPWLGIPFLLTAIALVARAWRSGKELEAAMSAEREVLTRAGVASYLNFQMKKVDELTSNTDTRSRSVELAEKNRACRARWESIVGPGITLDWAATHRPQIKEAARRLAGEPIFPAGHAAECLARAFVAARQAVGESMPVIIDEPFAELSDDELVLMLSALETYAPHMQFVAMTNDPRVVSWTSIRIAAGAVSLVPLGRDARPQTPTSQPNGVEARASAAAIAPPPPTSAPPAPAAAAIVRPLESHRARHEHRPTVHQSG